MKYDKEKQFRIRIRQRPYKLLQQLKPIQQRDSFFSKSRY
jgi:hypothetical protein